MPSATASRKPRTSVSGDGGFGPSRPVGGVRADSGMAATSSLSRSKSAGSNGPTRHASRPPVVTPGSSRPRAMSFSAKCATRPQ